MEEDLRTYLLSVAGVTSALGTRIHWGERPQAGALPAAVLTVVSDVTAYNMAGDSNLRATRVQVDVYGTTFASAKTGARAIVAALTGHSGVTGTTDFNGIFKDAESDTREAGMNDADRFFRTRVDFLVHHSST